MGLNKHNCAFPNNGGNQIKEMSHPLKFMYDSLSYIFHCCSDMGRTESTQGQHMVGC